MAPKILVVGAGGREHALVRALNRSAAAPELLCAPGNPGIGDDARLLAVAVDDVAGMADAAQAQAVDLVVIGPEVPLVAGLADELTARGITVFGPSKAAARLEGSKQYAKEVMQAAAVPTAAWRAVDDVDGGLAAIDSYPVVLKFDGLAAGKGVVIATGEAQARAALEAFLEQRVFGPGRVVIEECLAGEELSLLALCDGERALPMAPAQDYKRIFDGDEGPNTGGMGSYSPVPGVGAQRVAEICALVHQPIVDELRKRGTPFHGVLYAGIMLTADGPKVLEYNVRFGDPETQAVLPRLRSDLYELLLAAARPGGLEGAHLEFGEDWAVTLVLASAGYPAAPSTGDVIVGLEEVGYGIEVTHAGTRRGDDGAIVTAGGRVLNVTALGATPASARDAAYAAAQQIDFEGRQLRSDIALRAVERTSE
ncbi:MAG: Phosphoribosylamine--glycine ligase [uncultured Solirubrobacteraceae bacterium]|uniref:Phosphoribosylamine--glycine ligase n=1 Tax=uncultured Solirubrobacteraceae bacterium TaxID=1162706 RepID=A0A6J4SPV2_9ACTN|nr:MAG: Phosphoribosylamine--glycine ligase [uncultured Solirubrobacteraceae bacterium]